ncbi:DNA circularization N-terminal domain-containing protein [Undibacterium sp.]|uniref:DNA circularization protein n=1 Tax=Undibacterium sp. TaxID=1914977 RepID=UPI0025CDC6AD|nr:DNA circularization N-terminal domain-containing protein [Undibacterium sp.]
MTWANNLLTASFRDIEFDTISTDDAAPRALARHSYPYQDGEDIEDMGRNARKFSVQAIFFGDDYQDRLKEFTDVLDERGSGVLVHPIFGNIDRAQVVEYRVKHEADSVDSCTVSIEFEESTTSQPFFSRQLSSQKADAVDSAADDAANASAGVMTSEVNDLQEQADTGALSALARVNALRGQAVAFLTNINAEVRGIVASISDPIRGVISFVADITSLTQSLIDIVPNELEFLQNYAQSVFGRADRLLSPSSVVLASSSAAVATSTYPVPTAQLLADTQILTTHIAVQRAVIKSQVISLVLASESIEPTLTPKQIETLVTTARAAINDAIIAARVRYGVDNCRRITEPLKTLALAVQESGRAVILARPPLVTRTLDAPAPLRVLAHRWYGDHTRSVELIRLNNLRLPNALNAGDVINVYTK